MKRFPQLLLMVLMIMGTTAMAQEKSATGKSGGNDDGYTIMIVDHQEFGDEFVLFKTSDSKANYFVIDLEKLPDAFSKAYFMDLIYQQKEIVSIDSDFDKNYLWFKSFNMHDPEDILKQFDKLKTKTEHAGAEFSEEKKNLWLKVNNKY